MDSNKRKRLFVILGTAVAAAVIISAFVHAGEDDFISDPARLAGKWNVEEIWENEKLKSYDSTATIYIDKSGGYSLFITDPDTDYEQMGELQKKDGQLHFTGKDGWSYAIHGKQRQVIVTAKKGEKEETWLCQWDGYCGNAQRTVEDGMESHFKLLKKSTDKKDRISKSLYVSIMGRISNGYPQGEAITIAKEKCIRDEALVWYAGEHNIYVTDEELEAYLRWIIDALANPALADEKYDTALRKAGMTEEERVRAEAEGCRVDCIESKLRKTQSIEGWDDFEVDVVNRFRHTKAYRNLKVEMNQVVEEIKAEIPQ